MRTTIVTFILFMGVFSLCKAEYYTQRTFDTALIRRDATIFAAEAMSALVSATDCNLTDMEFAHNYCKDGATIQVTTTRRKKEKKEVAIPDYTRALHSIRCDNDAPYASIEFKFDFPSPNKNKLIMERNSVVVLVPVLQTYIGTGKISSKNYSDLTLRLLVVRYYYIGEVLKKEIDHIEAIRTVPYKVINHQLWKRYLN